MSISNSTTTILFQKEAAAALSILSALTPAERLVAVHLVDGFSNKEIASFLGKAEPTIKHQVSSIMDKTGVESRCRFIARYYQQLVCPLPAELSTRI